MGSAHDVLPHSTIGNYTAFEFDSSVLKLSTPVPTNVESYIAAADLAMDEVAPLDTG